MASTILTRDQVAGSRRIGTISFWIKRSLLGSQQHPISFENGDNDQLGFNLKADDKLRFSAYAYNWDANLFN